MPIIMRRFDPRAAGGLRVRRSMIVRLSKPICMLRWDRRGSRIAGGEEGRGGRA